MNDNKDTPEKINYWLSMVANIVTIGIPILTYFAANKTFLYVVAICLVLTVTRNIIKTRKLAQKDNALSSLKRVHEDLVKQSSVNQVLIDNLQKQNESFAKRLHRIHEDLLAGKVSSDILINYYIDEVDSQFIDFEKMVIEAYIDFIENAKLFDVIYSWNVLGRNPSEERILSKISFIISGDAIIKDNDELRLKLEIKKSNGDWQSINGYVNGSDKIKYLNIELGNYAILPNRSFNIRFSYVWPRSYVADGGDVFSFGSNTFSSTKPYDMSIKVHADKRCFSFARLQIRNKLDEYDCKSDFSELEVIEAGGENIVTVSLPASEKDRAIYISLIH